MPTQTAAAVAAVTETPAVTPSATVIPPGAPQTMTLWITELVAPLDSSAQSQVFEQQIAAFEATHPGLTIEVLHKKAEGKGGVQDFLVGASAVAPAVVPDLIALDTKYLADLARKGLLVPLDPVLSSSLLGDLYPFAIKACTVDGQLVGMQFETSIEHAVYNTSKIERPPVTWTDVFSTGATYMFPAAGRDGTVNDAFLIQYLSTGSELVDSNNSPALDQQALTDVLEFYRQGIASGAIPTDVLEYGTVEGIWPKYLQAEVAMSNISSRLYLAGPGSLTVNRATAIPTRDGTSIALSRGNAWALTVRDPNRQSLAVKLLEWLMHPANMAAWSQAAQRLPTRRAAFEQMKRDDYVGFVYSQLEYAVPYPSSDIHQRIYRAMQQAVDAVLRQAVLPEIAAENVLKTVNQETSP